MMQCTSCGAPIPAGSRFCSSCGHALAAAQPEERRIVTVLFADLVGFTALAERMDPEQVKRLVDACFERLVDDVHEFGGRVDKILGDGMLVLFGAPVAHEDDPERAVRAALRMQQTLASYVASTASTGGADIRMRIGINTGEVLVGTLAGTDYTAMGDVVNTASRLQSEAPPGGVMVGQTTFALTAHTFDYESVGELLTRGREQPLTGWLALHATAPPGALRRRRRDVGIVGRSLELAVADVGFDLVENSGRGLLLHVSGENGVGKSRFVDEVIRRIRARSPAIVLEGVCLPYGEANVWWPIASAVATHLDLDSSQPLDTLRAAALERANELVPSSDAAEVQQVIDVLAHLMGYPSPIDRLDAVNARSTIHSTVSRVLELRSQQVPLVLSIDDVQCADPVLLDLLEHLVASLSRHRFMLITAMRPGSDVVWPPRSDRSNMVTLSMHPLSRDDTQALAAEILRDQQPDATLLSKLYERSGGNPLFLLELVALTQAGGGQLELPDSLRTLIAARLDQLTLEQRQMLENAAVLGTSGSIVGLQRFAEATHQTFRHTTLQDLDDVGLLEVQGKRWEFRSDSVRDAAYQTLTKAARALRHAGVAKALSESPAILDDRAHHTAAAAELVGELGSVTGVPSTIAADAVRLLTEATDRALDSGSLRVTVRHATRAIDLAEAAEATDDQLAHLLVTRTTAYIDQREFERATADIEALDVIAARLDDTVVKAEAHRLRGTLANVAGRMAEARVELGTAVQLLRGSDRPELLANALRARGFIEMFGGSLIDAEWFFGEADDLFQRLGDERGMAYIEQHRAWLSFLSGDLALARQRLTHAATTLGKLGDRNGVGWAFGLLAFVEFFEQRFSAAEELAHIVRAEAEERGDEWAVGMMDTLLADLRLWQGKLDEALACAERARHRFRKLNDRFGTIQALAPLIRAQIALGRSAAAQRSAEELLALGEASSQGVFPMMAVAGAAMHRGAPEVAASLAERAIAEMAAIGAQAFEPRIVLALARAQQGRIDDALAAIESVPEFGADHPFTRAAAALVHAAAGLPGEAISDAETVRNSSGATYLDEVFAYIAAAAAHRQLGHPSDAELNVEAAIARAMAVGDLVAIALSTSAHRAITGTVHAAHDERMPLGEGWMQLVNKLAASGDQPASGS